MSDGSPPPLDELRQDVARCVDYAYQDQAWAFRDVAVPTLLALLDRLEAAESQDAHQEWERAEMWRRKANELAAALEAAERAIDEASQLQHRAEMGWADTRAALEAVERERDEARENLTAVEWYEEATQARARLLAAQQALRWYADEANWTQPTPWGTPIFDEDADAVHDCGKRARAALAAVGRDPQ